MLNIEKYLITKMAEECCEIAQTATKSICFGIDDRHPNVENSPSNRTLMVEELNDLLGVVQMMVEVGYYPRIGNDWISKKPSG